MSPRAGLLLSVAATLLAIAVGVSLGSAPLPLDEVFRVLTGGPADEGAVTIVREVRLPRVIAGVLTGAALAISGALFQALLRNPLAEPYLLGVSSGAAFGAVLALTALGGTLGAVPIAVFALAGGLAAIAIVFRVALAVGRLDTHVLILAGVAVAAFFGAAVMLLLSVAHGDALRAAVLWTMGSLERGGGGQNPILLVAVLGGGGIAFASARHLNALALGDEAAAHLGTRVETLRRLCYFTASLLAAVAVSAAGVIGFIGLVVPHSVRMLWGGDHRTLIPLAALGGATFLVLADAGARSLFRPLELPVGVVTAIVGVPLFLVLLRRTRV